MDRQAWLRWRHGGLGASDLPIIMGDSPWKTPLELYESKILPEPVEQPANFVTDRGNEFEPRIRSLFNLSYAKSMEPALLQATGFDFMRASLDGVSPDKKEILEIKTSGKEDWEASKKGIVPKKYIAQVQYALMVASADLCYYVSYWDPTWDRVVSRVNMVVVEVLPDRKYQAELLNAAQRFWMRVQKLTPPPLCDRDYKTIKAKGATDLSRRYKQLKERADAIDVELQETRAALITLAEEIKHPRCVVGDTRLIRVSKSGSIDYSSVEELKLIDLEKYRKPATSYWKIES